MIRNLFIFTVLFLCFITACNNEPKEAAAIPTKKTVVVIPEIFKKDTVISKHLTALSNNLDDFSAIIEGLANEIDALGIKDLSKPGVFEKLQLMKIVLPKTEPVLKLVGNIQQLDKVSEKIKDTLPLDKKDAFIAFEKKFQNKFDTLNLRFKKYTTTDNK